jgi:hypothetical protein
MMKHNAMAKGCRLDVSIGEIQTLLTLAKRGQDAAGGRLPLAEQIIGDLALALRAQERRAAEGRRAAADRAAGKPRTSLDPKRQRVMMIGDHHVNAERGDFVDIGTVDYAAWTTLGVREALGTVPPQAEIRRGVWLVRVSTSAEQREMSDRYFIGSDTTEDAADIEATARRIIERNW